MQGFTQKCCNVAGLAVIVTATACVHTDVQRTGRMQLGDGQEGLAPVLACMPGGFEEVAVITAAADGVATPERLTRHMQRRASLLGCDGIVDVDTSGETARAVCVRRREPVAVAGPVVVQVLEPSRDLLERAAAAGPTGQTLLQVLAQVQQRSQGERDWPLRWFLKTYPNSPFRDDVASLIVETPASRSLGRPATVRTAPTLP